MKYNISQAARIVGITRKTFYNHIAKKGISIEKDGQGGKLVDASELIRVYGDQCRFEPTDPVEESPTGGTAETPPVTTSVDTAVEVAVLKEKLAFLEEQRDHFEQLYKEEKTERQAGLRLLTDQREKQTQWEKSIEQLRQQMARENKELNAFKRETTEKLVLYKRALLAERNKTVWQRLFSPRKKSNRGRGL